MPYIILRIKKLFIINFTWKTIIIIIATDCHTKSDEISLKSLLCRVDVNNLNLF